MHKNGMSKIKSAYQREGERDPRKKTGGEEHKNEGGEKHNTKKGELLQQSLVLSEGAVPSGSLVAQPHSTLVAEPLGVTPFVALLAEGTSAPLSHCSGRHLCREVA